MILAAAGQQSFLIKSLPYMEIDDALLKNVFPLFSYTTQGRNNTNSPHSSYFPHKKHMVDKRFLY